MRARVVLTLLFIAAALAAGLSRPAAQNRPSALRWYKGNTHTHTLNSDGDSTPDDVVKWYREHGYAFLVLTDHNFLTSVDGLNALHGADEQFLVIKGEEVSETYGDRKPIHVNGLDVGTKVDPPGRGSNALEVMQKMVDGIRQANGVPHINHPNFEWAITADDLKQVEHTKLFEIYNGHPAVNNLGGGGVPGMEEVWDRLISSGKVIYGLADDDAHVFKQPWNAGQPLPGRGWVYVRADRLAPRAIVEALDRGDFYASTGVELNEYLVTSAAITIDIKPGSVSKYRVQFIGRNGQILSEVTSNPAVYRFKGDELYVRATIHESNGRLAWTQPVWRGR